MGTDTGVIVGDDGVPILPNESMGSDPEGDIGFDTIPPPSNDPAAGRGNGNTGVNKNKGKGVVASILTSLLPGASSSPPKTKTSPSKASSPPKIHLPFFFKQKNKGSDVSAPQDNGESKREGEEVGEGMLPLPSHNTAPMDK